MDITGISAFLLSNGPWGMITLYLLWDRHNLVQRLDTLTKSYTDNLLTIVSEVTKAISASTEAMRTSTQAQERATETQRAGTEAVKLLQAAVSGLEKDIERLDRESAA